jgi:hypothetical protein
MYDVFDSFLDGSTWHTRHPTDEKTFFLALHKVVRRPKFHPEEMGGHMREKLARLMQRFDEFAHGCAGFG